MAEAPRPLGPTWHRPHALLGYLCPSLRPEIVSGIALAGQQGAGLGAVGILGHLRGVDAGQADRQPLAAVLAPLGDAGADREHGGGLAGEREQQGKHSLRSSLKNPTTSARMAQLPNR